MKRLFLICTIFLCLVALLVHPSLAEALPAPSLSGEAAVLMDLDTGQVLCGKNAGGRMYPASTTKILTALVALQQGRLEDTITAGQHASTTDGSSIYLLEGERHTLEELLYGLLLNSGNDCAVAIAEHIGGSQAGFVAMMNKEAVRLGAKDSHFANPHGLHDVEHYTTAEDLAKIAREALKNPVFRRIVSTQTRPITRPDDKRPEVLINRNKLLWQYDGAFGVKTGYTEAAGQCLVAAAEQGGQRLLSVVLKSQGPALWTDTKALLDYGFAAFPRMALVTAGQEVGSVPVEHGREMLRLTAGDDFSWCLPSDARFAVRWDLRLEPDLQAPVSMGSIVGRLAILDGDRQIGEVPLRAAKTVHKRPLPLWVYLGPPVALVVLWLFLRGLARRRSSRLRRYR